MNINKLVDSYYSKMDEDDYLINEVMKFLIVEADASMPPRASFDWSMIPDIPISEIGWSDVSTVKDERGKEKTILGPQRALLQQYLDNIGSPDGTFEEQIASLQEFYGPNGPQGILDGANGNTAEAIGKLISYLVFYKTLTKVVTNFNAASAGFSFEAFLAVLLNGKQIDVGGGTIADFLTGDDLPVSLKLYTKLKVGGSWNDLVKDIVNPKFSHPWKGKDGAQGNAMRYVSGIKRLSGEGLTQQGKIELYQFDITLDNIVDIMLTSVKPSVVAMPRSLMVGGEDLAATLPDRADPPTPDELTAQFRKNLSELLPKIEIPPSIQSMDIDLAAYIDTALQQWQYDEEIDRDFFAKNWQGLAFTRMPYPGRMAAFLKKVFLEIFGPNSNYDGRPPLAKHLDLYMKQLAMAIKNAHNAIADTYAAKEINSTRAAAVANADWSQLNKRSGKGINRATTDEEVITDAAAIKKYYDGLDVEGKKRALLNTYGMLGTKERQWEINEKQATSPNAPINSVRLGELQIGGALVEAMLEQVSGLLNGEIFAVFSLLKDLSDNLNGFFAGGLSDDKKAGEAIKNAQAIQKRTAEAGSEDLQLSLGFEE
jgi:hypothetical protein